MHARDAAGRQVSLLNDDASQHPAQVPQIQRPSYQTASRITSQPFHGVAAFAHRSSSPLPATPELLRSDSYDSHRSHDSMSPMTPVYDYTHPYAINGTPIFDGRLPVCDDYMGDYSVYPRPHKAMRPPMYHSNSSSDHTGSYDGDDTSSTGPPSSASSSAPISGPGKRYPCRYRDTHGCEKTFTTSGHASRHSKIHTAEKAVHCTFPGCTKKFTRADNMKQHLETHYKDKARGLGSSRLSLAERRSSRSRRSTPSSSSTSPSSPARGIAHQFQLPAAAAAPMPSPGEMWGVRSGLDALALAIACQEGA